MEENPSIGAPLFFDASQVGNDEQGRMSALSAVETLLIEVGKPLNCSEITSLILKRKLWASQGKTPDATIHAQLAVDIKKHASDSRFQRTAPSVFALRSWGLPEYERQSKKQVQTTELKTTIASNKPVVPLNLTQQIQEHNKAVYKELHNYLLNMAPSDFETLIGELLTALGFEDVNVTNPNNDGGIDVRGILVVGGVIRTKMAVQVKRWKHNVHSPTVQQVRGSLGTHDQGLIITTSDFSSGAREEAERANAIPVALMNGQQLIRLLVENNLGVRRTQHDLFELEVAV
ncbi:MAG TPA: restriction endonuclease [Abditibacterium sp.]|jgi:restriction system protein